MKFVDIHAHLDFPDYNADRAEVIKRTQAAGCGVINVGVDLPSSRAVLELAREHQLMWATVGLHPVDHQGSLVMTEADWQELESLAREPEVVAIGECGLDYFRLPADNLALAKGNQKVIFERQIELAIRVGKPLMLHIREAYDDVLDILKNFPAVKAHAHFFAAPWETARRFLNSGITISFTGVITFSTDYDEVIKRVPREMLLAETDSPFVSPVPHRGLRNEPLRVEWVIRRLAEVRGEPVEEFYETLLANSRRVFDLK